MKILTLHEADSYGVVSPDSLVCSLPDAYTAFVRREVNGEYSLTVSLPSGARKAEEVTIGRAIRATVNENGDQQFFVVRRRNRSLIDGMTIYAEHQSYLFNGIMLGPGQALHNANPATSFAGFHTYAVPDISSICTWTYDRTPGLRVDFPAREVPRPLMSLLKDYLIANAGGEMIFDGLDCRWVDAMGSDNGASYRYGVNLTEMDAEDVPDNYFTGIFPYWGSFGDENRPFTQISGKVLMFDGNFPIESVIAVDFTSQFETQPSREDLLAAAQAYASQHTPTGFPLSIRVNRARIAGDVSVDLGDTVHIINSRYGINTTSRVMALNFNALSGRVADVELGTVNPGFPGAVRNMK